MEDRREECATMERGMERGTEAVRTKEFEQRTAPENAAGEMAAKAREADEPADDGEAYMEKTPHGKNASQLYIGVPNGIVLCADKGAEHKLRGRFYHAYRREPVLFDNAVQFVLEMEKFFDSINFPYPSTNIRSFREKRQVIHRINKKERIMKDEELLTRHGDLGSFIIRVQQRQNSSMQGRLTWIEKNRTVHFRSVWEMIRLIDSAIGPDRQGDDEDFPSWEE